MVYQRRAWSLKRAEIDLAGAMGRLPKENLELSADVEARNVVPRRATAPKFRNVNGGVPALEIA